MELPCKSGKTKRFAAPTSTMLDAAPFSRGIVVVVVVVDVVDVFREPGDEMKKRKKDPKLKVNPF